MPIPVVSALAGGQLLIGKLRFREFCFTPLSGSPFPEQLKILVNVHSELGKAVQGKAGVSGPPSGSAVALAYSQCLFSRKIESLGMRLESLYIKLNLPFI